MKLRIIGIVFLLLWCFSPQYVFAQSQNSVEGDRQALVDLYNATNGDNWSNSSGWLDGNPSSSWHGVETDSQGRVVHLDLFNNNLSGQLPSSIGNLSQLKYLNVKQNTLTGEIPVSIGNLVSLEWLLLAGLGDPKEPPTNPTKAFHPGKSNTSGNNFSGVIPSSIGNLKSLMYLEISGTSLSGSLPSEIGGCTSLKFLSVSWNGNMTGQLPSSINNLVNITHFYMTRNSLTGSIPAVNNLTDLRFFNLGGGNAITGDLPDFSNSTQLRSITLSGMKLVGGGITGDFPSYFGNGQFNDLVNIGFGNNNFTGNLPNFSNLRLLRVFNVANNNMTGEIPESITLLNNDPNIINLGWNNFEGQLPQTGWEDMRIARYLRFSGNKLTGPIPSSLPNVRDIYLHDNAFTGFDGQAFIDLAKQHGRLETVNISGNKIPQDDIEPAITPLSNEGVSFSYGNQNPD